MGPHPRTWPNDDWAVDDVFWWKQAVYSKTHAMVLMYGGQGYSDWQTPSVNITTETSVLSDFWWVPVAVVRRWSVRSETNRAQHR